MKMMLFQSNNVIEEEKVNKKNSLHLSELSAKTFHSFFHIKIYHLYIEQSVIPILQNTPPSALTNIILPLALLICVTQ